MTKNAFAIVPKCVLAVVYYLYFRIFFKKVLHFALICDKISISKNYKGAYYALKQL